MAVDVDVEVKIVVVDVCHAVHLSFIKNYLVISENCRTFATQLVYANCMLHADRLDGRVLFVNERVGLG